MHAIAASCPGRGSCPVSLALLASCCCLGRPCCWLGGGLRPSGDVGDVCVHAHIHEQELAAVGGAQDGARRLATCDRLKHGGRQLWG